jgi:hypothetical protein
VSIVLVCGILFANPQTHVLTRVCLPYDRSVFTAGAMGHFGSYRFGRRGGSEA